MPERDLTQRLRAYAQDGWHRGQLLGFSGIESAFPADHEGAIILRTMTEPAGIAVVFPGSARLTFAVTPQSAVVANDFLIADGTLRGVLVDPYHFLIEGEIKVDHASDELRVETGHGRTLIGTAARFDPSLLTADLRAHLAARSAWLLGQPRLLKAAGPRRQILFRALAVMKGQVSGPEGALSHAWTTPDRFPHKDMWLWDSVFHAIGWRHLDQPLARAMIEAVLDGQRPDGFVPHQMSPTRRPSGYTQPPLLALGAQLVNDIAPDPKWIAHLYPKLAAAVEWDLAHRDHDGDGLLEWFIEGDPTSRSGESGMDNSPRFDFHYPTALAVTDFNAYIAHECEILGDWAQRLGRAADAMLWRGRHGSICHRINNSLWSVAQSFYCDYDTAAEEQSPVLASSGFLPLLCGAPSVDQAKALLGHLESPESFGTAFPVPSIAASEPGYYAKDMWRGPSWININWLIARGLERYASYGAEFSEAAVRIDEATIAEIERHALRFGTFFEYYDDRREVEPPQLLRKGICDPENPFRQVIHDYGWTTTLYLDLIARRSAPE
jgi:putative isomerase